MFGRPPLHLTQNPIGLVSIIGLGYWNSDGKLGSFVRELNSPDQSPYILRTLVMVDRGNETTRLAGRPPGWPVVISEEPTEAPTVGTTVAMDLFSAVGDGTEHDPSSYLPWSANFDSRRSVVEPSPQFP
eukprot:sb/3475236/